jgi:hypothetical protein
MTRVEEGIQMRVYTWVYKSSTKTERKTRICLTTTVHWGHVEDYVSGLIIYYFILFISLIHLFLVPFAYHVAIIWC